MDALVETSGALRSVAVSLVKICNDLRWMGSGPRTGLGEIQIPDLQPGSSIMPGKVNPVIPEATLMVAAQVIGNDATVAFAGASGTFELNVMLPVIARNLLESVTLLTGACEHLAAKCVDGITANVDRCRRYAESSPSIVTPLNRLIGYENAAKIAKHAVAADLTIRAGSHRPRLRRAREPHGRAARRRPRRHDDDDPTAGLSSLGFRLSALWSGQAPSAWVDCVRQGSPSRPASGGSARGSGGRRDEGAPDGRPARFPTPAPDRKPDPGVEA